MTWMSAQELKDSITKLPNTESDQLFRAFALSLFVRNAFYSPDFEPVEDWAGAVTLTRSGTELLAELHEAGIRYSESVEYFTLLRIFYHHALLSKTGSCSLK